MDGKKNYLIEKIKIRAIRHGVTPSISRIKNKYLRYLVTGLNIVRFYILHPDYFIHSKLYLSNVEIVLTTNCTLKCKNCCHYIPLYKNVPYESSAQIIIDIEKLLCSVKRIDEFRVMGGEPLLYPYLSDVVSYLLQSEKIGKVEIVTNGTLPLGKDILNLFPSSKLNIFVSNYGKLSKQLNEYASNIHINKTITKEDYYWRDHGTLKYRGQNIENLKKQFKYCYKDKYILYKGKLFSCACSAFGTDLNVFKPEDDEYVDIRNSNSEDSLRNSIKRMKRRKYFTACNYCFWGTDLFIPIKAAEQIE